jgi:ABC-type anion transport system duplicated permease subunit
MPPGRSINSLVRDAGLVATVLTVRLRAHHAARVIVLIALASLIWVPIGVWIGLRPKLAERMQPLAQFLAAFPANLLFPVVVVVIIVRYGLNPTSGSAR